MEKYQWCFPVKTTTMPACFHLLIALLFVTNSCTDTRSNLNAIQPGLHEKTTAETIRGISLPAGFSFVENGDTAYANWLLDLPLKKSKTVYLYNGNEKPDQNVQYGVLDIDIGKKDLVQCADAVMKIRSDYLFEKHRYNDLDFTTTSGDNVSFQKWLKGIRWKEQGSGLSSYKITKRVTDIRKEYNRFMEFVYSYCGSYSLAKQLKTITDTRSIQPGDIFIEGGFPGHAVTVMAVAGDSAGNRAFLLSQGYMPAQDIHILKNYSDPGSSPWYRATEIYPLYTPKWQFERGSLRRW